MFVETPRKVITIKAFDPSARMFISANNMFLFFLFVHAYIDIFLFPAIWLAAGAGSFLRYVDRGPKELFLATNRGVKTIFKLKTLPKKFKNPPYRY